MTFVDTINTCTGCQAREQVIKELEAEIDELQEHSDATAHDMCDYRNEVMKLNAELDVANKESEENLRRATELESKISFWFAIGIVAASFAIITLGYYIDTA